MGLDKPNVLGWSMSGMTAQILAAKYGDEIGGVILAGTTPGFAIEGIIPVPQEWLGTATKEQIRPEDMQYLFYADTASSRAAGMASLARIGGGDADVGAASKTTMQTNAAQGPQRGHSYLARAVRSSNWAQSASPFWLPMAIRTGLSRLRIRLH